MAKLKNPVNFRTTYQVQHNGLHLENFMKAHSHTYYVF